MMKKIIACLIDQHDVPLVGKQEVFVDETDIKIQPAGNGKYGLHAPYLILERTAGPYWSERIALQAFYGDSAIIMANGRILDHKESIELSGQNTVMLAIVSKEKGASRCVELAVSVEKKHRGEAKAGILMALLLLLALSVAMLWKIEAYNQLLSQSLAQTKEGNYASAYDSLNAACAKKKPLGILSRLLVNDRKVRDSIQHHLLQDLAEGKCLEDFAQHTEASSLNGLSDIILFNCRQEQMVTRLLAGFFNYTPKSGFILSEFKMQVGQLKEFSTIEPYKSYDIKGIYKTAESQAKVMELLLDGMKKHTVSAQTTGKLNALKSMISRYGEIHHDLPPLIKDQDENIMKHFRILLQDCIQRGVSEREQTVVKEIKKLLTLNG